MRQQGFTLIELLLGLIVSGILAGLATPVSRGCWTHSSDTARRNP